MCSTCAVLWSVAAGGLAYGAFVEGPHRQTALMIGAGALLIGAVLHFSKVSA